MPLTVCTWNLFHGRASVPGGDHPEAIEPFAEALAAAAWDVCALQEVPPWWPRELARRCGASVRTARTSWWRSLLPSLQRVAGRRYDLGTHGAAVNALLVRPGGGVITDHRTEVLRRAPQRRTVHGVRIVRPSGEPGWVCNLHAHNQPAAAAAADTRRALQVAGRWAGHEPVVLAGDLNLAHPAALAAESGFVVLHGQRVDHLLGRGVDAVGGPFARRIELPGGGTASDHRLVGVTVRRR